MLVSTVGIAFRTQWDTAPSYTYSTFGVNIKVCYRVSRQNNRGTRRAPAGYTDCKSPQTGRLGPETLVTFLQSSSLFCNHTFCNHTFCNHTFCNHTFGR